MNEDFFLGLYHVFFSFLFWRELGRALDRFEEPSFSVISRMERTGFSHQNNTHSWGPLGVTLLVLSIWGFLLAHLKRLDIQKANILARGGQGQHEADRPFLHWNFPWTFMVLNSIAQTCFSLRSHTYIPASRTWAAKTSGSTLPDHSF